MVVSGNAMTVLQKRFFREGEDWPALCRRVADVVAAVEPDKRGRQQWSDIYADMMQSLHFLPNSPTLRNFGRNNGCGSACFVLPIEDSRRSIFNTLSEAVDVQAYGGGTGIDFSPIRPAGDTVHSTGGRAAGPVSIIGIFDYTIGDIITQGGVRHGANMGILRVDHPDIRDFVHAKADNASLRNFNISVGITDAFMKAVEGDEPFTLRFNGSDAGEIRAADLWQDIVSAAWRNGEPGMVFLDTVNRHNPLGCLGPITATNPCGEQPLLPYSSCNLGAINLARMITGDWLTGPAEVDYPLLETTVRNGVRFLDSVISVNRYPLDAIADMSRRTRQIGLGIMGFADLCIARHLRYGSEDASALAAEVMAFIYRTADEASVELGRKKGMAPVFEDVCRDRPARRNGALTSIAPTGTLSVIADCASGCEPYFSLNYEKSCLDGKSLAMMPVPVRQWVDRYGDDPLPAYMVTAEDISIDSHIDLQAAFQNSGIDAAVSKTINAPFETTREQVSEAFFNAWRSGCKGVTFYRNGSRADQPLRPVNDGSDGTGLGRGELKKRPRATTGPSLKMKTACGNLYVDPHFDHEGPVEVFIRTEGGGCEANTRALGMMISYCLRAGVRPENIIKSLGTIKCQACARAIGSGRNVEVASCAAGMAKALGIAVEDTALFRRLAAQIDDADKYFSENDGASEPDSAVCPDCGGHLNRAGGCLLCANPGCGWSRC